MEEDIIVILTEAYRFDHLNADFWIEKRLNDWSGEPWSFAFAQPSVSHTATHTQDQLLRSRLGIYWAEVDSLIKNADLTLCLTSKYKYIREYKKYLLGK